MRRSCRTYPISTTSNLLRAPFLHRHTAKNKTPTLPHTHTPSYSLRCTRALTVHTCLGKKIIHLQSGKMRRDNCFAALIKCNFCISLPLFLSCSRETRWHALSEWYGVFLLQWQCTAHLPQFTIRHLLCQFLQTSFRACLFLWHASSCRCRRHGRPQ